MIKSRLTAVLVLAAVLIAAVASYTSPILAQEEDQEELTEHGSASSDLTGKPEDPNHWGDSASDFGNANIMGDHSREGSAPGDAPFDNQFEGDTQNGRVGVGNNDGDGPSGHAGCVDGDPETDGGGVECR